MEFYILTKVFFLILFSRIQQSLYCIFIKQLYQWLIYGRSVDPYGEFFIQQIGDSIAPSATGSSITSFHHSASSNMYALGSAPSESASSINTELWRYEVAYSMLPYYFSATWAENVLLTGQTVLTFNSSSNSNKMRDEDQDLSKKLNNYGDGIVHQTTDSSLWGDQEEHEIFRRFHELQSEEILNIVSKLEHIVNAIKSCVTEHLFNVAMDDADLVAQMRLIKDYFLLGRGELYHEFIKLIVTSTAAMHNNEVWTQRELNRFFVTAGNSVNIFSEDIEQFSFSVAKDGAMENRQDRYASSGIWENDFINGVTLKYKVKWPLHLLFSPKVLERYNEMFRFLLKIKKTQYDLQQVWSQHRQTKEVQKR